jgi:diphthine-ammonia ligase
VGRALGVPLYRRVISGSAVETGLNYGTREGVNETQTQDVAGDETEDLFHLLQEVKVDSIHLYNHFPC